MAAGQTSCRRKSCVFKLACQYCPFRKIRKNKNYDSEAGGSAMDTGPLPSLQAVPEGVPPSGSDPDPPSRALADRDNQNWVQPEDRAPSLQPDQDRIPEHRESSMEMDMDVDPETGERALG